MNMLLLLDYMGACMIYAMIFTNMCMHVGSHAVYSLFPYSCSMWCEYANPRLIMLNVAKEQIKFMSVTTKIVTPITYHSGVLKASCHNSL